MLLDYADNMPLKHPYIKPSSVLIQKALSQLSIFHPLSEDIQQYLADRFIDLKAKEGEFLLKQGEISEYFYFIVSGILVGYTNRNEKKISSYICAEGEFVSSISGMYGINSSGESIYVAENAHILCFPVQDLVKLLETSFEMNVIIRKMVEMFYRSAHERSNMTRMGTAQERYEHYLSTTSHFIDRIPANYIADLLDIKPQTLAKILKDRKANKPGNLAQQCAIIEDYMEGKQAFKQKGLSLHSMATALAIPAHQLSQILNVHYKKGFSAFVNSYRVAYIKIKLQESADWQRMKIEALGIESGFSSRSVFFSEFKNYVGMSPVEFAKANAN